MSILTTIGGAVTGQAWKFGAIGLLAAGVACSAFLGYQWHSAASARDTAVTERAQAEQQRDKALTDKGELVAHIGSQNASILALATKSAEAMERSTAAMQAFAPIKASIKALADRIAAQAPSVSCEQSLAKQRAAIEGLRAVPK
jgi:hypothetical protein